MKPGIIVKSAGDNVKRNLGIKRAATTIIAGSDGATNDSGVVMSEDSTFEGFTATFQPLHFVPAASAPREVAEIMAPKRLTRTRVPTVGLVTGT